MGKFSIELRICFVSPHDSEGITSASSHSAVVHHSLWFVHKRKVSKYFRFYTPVSM